MNTSEEISELAKALAVAQGEFTAIPKDSDNPFFKSKYAGLAKVVEVASPILSKNGLSVSQWIGTSEHGDVLTTWLLHESGQYMTQDMRLILTKNDSQGQGSAVTYARRYSYQAILGLVADDDDDGNAASKQSPKAGNQNSLKQAVKGKNQAPPAATEPETDTVNLTKFVLGELTGGQAPEFSAWLNINLRCGMNAVPKKYQAVVEQAVATFAGGQIPPALAVAPSAP